MKKYGIFWIMEVVFFLFFTFTLNSLVTAIIFLVATSMPVFIRRLNLKKENYFRYGGTILLLAPIIYYVRNMYTCTDPRSDSFGLSCSFEPMVYSAGFFLLAIIYYLSLSQKK